MTIIGISSVGFTPLGPVTGRSTFAAGAPVPACGLDDEVRPDAGASWLLHKGWERALQRLRKHCVKMRGDGVIAVNFSLRTMGDQVEFFVSGKAVRAVGSEHTRWPFTAHLQDDEFANLVSAGWVPAGAVLGIGISRRHRLPQSPGSEQRDHTEILGRTIAAARVSLREDAGRYGADGIVVRGIAEEVQFAPCGSDKDADLYARVVVLGTAIAQFRHAGRRPLTVMPLGAKR